jgi:hypothetical protein
MRPRIQVAAVGVLVTSLLALQCLGQPSGLGGGGSGVWGGGGWNRGQPQGMPRGAPASTTPTRVSALMTPTFPLPDIRNESQEYVDIFNELSSNNIFLSTRGRRPPVPPDPVARVLEVRRLPPVQKERTFVLKGVAMENDELRAYIEDASNAMVPARSVGDLVARGIVKSITLDGIVYQSDDGEFTVPLGYDLAGIKAMATRTIPRMADEDLAPTISGGNSAQMEEAMKRRRLDQLGSSPTPDTGQ